MALTKRKKWGIALVLLPGTLLVATLILQVIVRFAFAGAGSSGSEDCQVAASSSEVCESQPESGALAKRIINIFTILMGATAVIGAVPSIVGGVILLATPGKQVAQSVEPPYQGPLAV